MIRLGDLTLPDDMLWEGRETYTGVAAAAQTMLDGSSQVYESEVAGQKIDLASGADYGWLTYAQVIALRSMARAVGTIYDLTYGDEVLSVRFRHEDGGALEFTPIIERPQYDDNDYFYGTIKLMEA
jgi:hypothetical protein